MHRNACALLARLPPGQPEPDLRAGGAPRENPAPAWPCPALPGPAAGHLTSYSLDVDSAEQEKLGPEDGVHISNSLAEASRTGGPKPPLVGCIPPCPKPILSVPDPAADLVEAFLAVME